MRPITSMVARTAFRYCFGVAPLACLPSRQFPFDPVAVSPDNEPVAHKPVVVGIEPCRLHAEHFLPPLL